MPKVKQSATQPDVDNPTEELATRQLRLPAPRKLLLDINEVAAVLGIGRRTAYVLRGRPGFPKPIALGSRVVRYRADDVRKFVDALAANAVPAAEPEQLRAGKAGRRLKVGGASGGPEVPIAGKPRQARAVAERSGFEPKLRVRE
jgi:predicted DNA-binding transcriptional regulator AlpA